MGLKIWKPTCPSCGMGLRIQKGQIYVLCECCGSNLIIEGWEAEIKPYPTWKEEYGMTGIFTYSGTPPHARTHEW